MLQNQSTLIGINFSKVNNKWQLVQERLDQFDPRRRKASFCKQDEEINVILVMEKFNCLFASCLYSHLVQFELNSEGSRPILVKKYRDIGVGVIFSAISVSDLAVFGGCSNLLAIIEPETQKVLSYKTPVEIDFIYSLSKCSMRTYDFSICWFLAVSGETSLDSSNKTDFITINRCPHTKKLSVQSLDIHQSIAGSINISDDDSQSNCSSFDCINQKSNSLIDSESRPFINKDSNSNLNSNLNNMSLMESSPDQNRENQLEKLRQELKSSSEIVRTLKADLDKVNAENEKLRVEYNELESHFSEIKSKYEDTCQINEKLKEENSVFQSDLKDLKNLFCKVNAININPLIDLSDALMKIRRIFKRWILIRFFFTDSYIYLVGKYLIKEMMHFLQTS